MPTITKFRSHVGPAERTPPKGVPVEVENLHDFATHINANPSPTKKACFSVNSFEGGEKHQRNYRGSSGFVAIDLEGPKTDPLPDGALEAIFDLLQEKELGFVWYHTHSHLNPPETKGERARVILFCSPAPTTTQEYRALIRAVMAEFPDGSFDRSCVDPARGFFYPPEQHLAVHVPGRTFIWDPSIATLSDPSTQTTRPDSVPEVLCCDPADLDTFTSTFREVVEVAEGNRNYPALWFLGALHCAGADEELCRYHYHQAFENLPEHLRLFQQRYDATAAKSPGDLKIWGDFQKAGPFSNPEATDGLMSFLGKLDGEPLKALLTPKPAVESPTPPAPTPNTFPLPKSSYSLLLNDETHTVVNGFIDEFFGRDHFRVRSGVGYFYDSTTWQEAPPDVLLGTLREYQLKVEHVSTKDGSPKRVCARRDISQLRELEQAIFSPSRDATFIPESEPFEDPDYLALTNGLLHLPTLTLQPFTSTVRTLGTLPVAYEPENSETPQLDAFFDSCKFSEGQRKAWLDGVGYLLFGAAGVYQKAVLMVGPPRAGKGVSSALVSSLIGERNTTPVSIQAFGEMFGLQGAINRKLMIVNDAEFPRAGFGNSVAGKLKQVIAGEPTSVNRKHLKDWKGTLGKLLVCSNVAPRIEGGDRALSGRWHIVEFTESHLRREDLGVLGRLLGEQQQIFNRLLLNWVEVQEAGHLHQPESAEEYRQETLQASDVVEGFVAERLQKTDNPEDYISRSSTWDEFKLWQEENVTSAQRIGKYSFLQSLRTLGFEVRKNVGPKHLQAFVGVKLI